MTVGFPPLKLTRAPEAGGGRARNDSSTPAFFSSSLYFIIACTASALGMASGAADAYPPGIISIIKRIGLLLGWVGSITRRTRSRGIDRSAKKVQVAHS